MVTKRPIRGLEYSDAALYNHQRIKLGPEDVYPEKEKNIILSYFFNLKKKSQSLPSVPMLLQPCYKNKHPPPSFSARTFGWK